MSKVDSIWIYPYLVDFSAVFRYDDSTVGNVRSILAVCWIDAFKMYHFGILYMVGNEKKWKKEI